MNAFSEFRRATVGWLDLIAGRPEAAENFNLSRAGLINATAFYFALVLLTLLIDTVARGSAPNLIEVGLGIGINGLPLLGFWTVCWITSRILGAPIYGLLVPGTYAMAFVLLVGLPLSLFFANTFSNALLGALGYMFYRAGRQTGGMRVGVSIAFAILSIVVLVALPIGLYMLATQGQGIG